jgi:DeoR family ulaG and ulaABCDEF operon transcriptional repressor
MLAEQRYAAILRILGLYSVASIHDVVEATGASESTIRRDFCDLEREGRLIRVRGGVRLPDNAHESATDGPASAQFEVRTTVNQEKKRRIAQKACSLIRDGDTIFIDGGTTTFFMVEFLASLSVHVITNSLAIANHLLNHSRCSVTVPEGTIDPESLLILNNLSSDPFSNYTAAMAIMGTEGITESVITNKEKLLIQAERAMIQHARRLVILADDTKFGKLGHLTLCPVETASTIVTTTEADPALLDALAQKGINIIQA